MKEYTIIRDASIKRGIEAEINRGINEFSLSPSDTGLFKLWCYLISNDKINNIPKFNYHSVDTEIKRLTYIGWIEVNNDTIRIL